MKPLRKGKIVIGLKHKTFPKSQLQQQFLHKFLLSILLSPRTGT